MNDLRRSVILLSWISLGCGRVGYQSHATRMDATAFDVVGIDANPRDASSLSDVESTEAGFDAAIVDGSAFDAAVVDGGAFEDGGADGGFACSVCGNAPCDPAMNRCVPTCEGEWQCRS